MLRMRQHNIEKFFASSGYAPNDVGTWVQSRELPWNVIGKELGEANVDMTAAEALREAGLDIHVEKWPTTDPDGNQIPKLWVTGYDDSEVGRVYFAGVSDKYKVAQPVEALTFFDDVVHARAGAHYSSVWNMREKSMMGVTIEFPDEIVVDPGGADDVVGLYGLGVNSFDGSTGLGFYVTPVRMFCMNQLSGILRGGARRSVTFKHTTGVVSRVQEAREAIGVTLAWAEEFDLVANVLYTKEMTDRQFERLVKSIGGPNGFHLDGDETDLIRGRIEGRRAQVMEAWRAEHNGNITGTRWGAYNVLAEYAEWGRRVVGSPRTGTTATRQRAIGTMVNWPTAFRTKVLDRLMSMN